MSQVNTPVLLCIMDGFGIDAPGPGNAISLADKPNLDRLFQECPHTLLQASGSFVGLPDGQMGNSEVGHLNIGAGRVVHQELSRINMACDDGSISENAVINGAIDAAWGNGGVVHFMGLLSNGGVHSSIYHLFSLLRHAVEYGDGKIAVHCFMDGRDVDPKSGSSFIRELEALIDQIGPDRISIASVSGRYYAMDRDKRWDRVGKAYDTVVCGCNLAEGDPADLVDASYADGVTDEFIIPFALDDRGICDGDSVIFFNFRPDRARQISHAICDEAFDGFDRKRTPNVQYVCLTEYEAGFGQPIAFPKSFPQNVLADVISHEGLRQFHIAETEKYAHVTFFLNGGIEEPKAGEERCLIPSPKVATYDLQPEMSEPLVAERLAKAIRDDEADVYIVNFANCDMVGHTGIVDAAKRAVEAVDQGVGMILDAMGEKHGISFVTADHGNADKMITDEGKPHTAHTTAPVPFILVDATGDGRMLVKEEGALCDIAPTILDAMGIPAPEEFNGRSLLVH